VQTGKAPNLPIVLVDEDYWTRIIDFDALKDAGMIAAADIDLLRFADTGEEAWRVLNEMGLRVP
jgi:predicted Rossmann-fold nucleotide-binding protein